MIISSSNSLMDEDELQKRNTDCVYFLASPLTCKKGIECEYRHSEIARLNPRDCWYWLAGTCLNPSCTFRHPPVEGRTEALSEPADTHQGLNIPVNKTNVPCYFYFSGFCSKGDRCSFLHGPDESAPAWKPTKAMSEVNDAVPLENKVYAGSNTGSTIDGRHPNPSQTAPNEPAHTQSKLKQDLHQLAPNLERSGSLHISATQSGEAAEVRSESLPPAEGLIQNEDLACIDQSSDERVDGHVEQEEWLESSPGFDVLVEDQSENLGYEDDADYLPVLDDERRELNSQFADYDYEDPIEYDTAYPESEIPYEREKYEAYDCLDNEQACDYISKVSEQSGERNIYHISARKRKFLQMEPTFNGQRGMDLRDHLRKRRVGDDCLAADFSRRHDSSRLIDRIRGKPQWHGFRSANRILKNGFDRRDRFRQPHVDRFRQHIREKRNGREGFLPAEVSRKSAPSKRKCTEESFMFSGPKTLDQIREEKKRAQENGDISDTMWNSSRPATGDFEGPRPLHEILKDKRRLGSEVESLSR